MNQQQRRAAFGLAPGESFLPVIEQWMTAHPGAPISEFEQWARRLLDFSVFEILEEEEYSAIARMISPDDHALGFAVLEELGVGP